MRTSVKAIGEPVGAVGPHDNNAVIARLRAVLIPFLDRDRVFSRLYLQNSHPLRFDGKGPFDDSLDGHGNGAIDASIVQYDPVSFRCRSLLGGDAGIAFFLMGLGK